MQSHFSRASFPSTACAPLVPLPRPPAGARAWARPARPHALTAHPQCSRVPERLHPSHSVSLRPAFESVFSPAASWLPTELASRWLWGSPVAQGGRW